MYLMTWANDEIYHFIIVKALKGVMYGLYSTKGVVKRVIQHEAKPSDCMVLETTPRVLYTHTARHSVL